VCDYGPYGYETKQVDKSINKTIFGWDSSFVEAEVVADTTVNNVNYTVLNVVGKKNGIVIGVSRSILRCGNDGFFQNASSGALSVEMKIIPGSPKLGDTWVMVNQKMYQGTNNEVDYLMNGEVVEIVPSITVQGKTFTNVLKVLAVTNLNYTVMGFSQKVYSVYYLDKANGSVMTRQYNNFNEAMNNVNFISSQEQVSLVI
jgi:hypothetical protein